MIEKFNDFVSDYDLNNIDILSKYNHSMRVMNLMVKYAKILNYSSDDVEICRIVGLLHDIGRFEQLKVYKTYVDYKSVDHADYSVQQLFEKNKIKLFCSRIDWYPIIEYAIRNHNKLELADCDDERTLRIAKLLRDADKMDVIYTIGVLRELKNEAKDMEISNDVIKCVFEHKNVDLHYVNNYNDRLVVQMAFVFGIYNSVVLEEYKGYLKSYYEVVCKGEQFKKIYNEIEKYIKERLDKYERNGN